MARIYYRANTSTHQKFISTKISIDFFDSLFRDSSIKNFVLSELSNNTNLFHIVKLHQDDIEYNSPRGNFYLPRSIIFCDREDAIFPTEFYFISKIDTTLEVGKCLGGPDIEWFETPDLQEEVTEIQILEKIEDSLHEVRRLIDIQYHNSFALEKQKKAEKEREEKEKSRPHLSEEEKIAYKNILELCLPKEKKMKKIFGYIDTLKNYNSDTKYFSTLHVLLGFLEENDVELLVRFDWKSSQEEGIGKICAHIKNNFHTTIALGEIGIGDNADYIFDEKTLEIIQEKLTKEDLNVISLNMESDEYVLLIHRANDTLKIQKSLSIAGYL